MKKIILLFTLFISMFWAIAQVPQAISYQAAVRNSAGEVLKNQNVSFRISILTGSVTGTAVYTETHSVTTNQFGLVNLLIGRGNAVIGTFDGIDWASGSKFSKIELDVTGGTNYTEMGVSEIVSVAFSYFSDQSQKVALEDKDSDNTNEIQDLVLEGNLLKITNNDGATIIDLTPFLNTDSQTLSYDPATRKLAISGGNEVEITAEKSLYSVMTLDEFRNLTNPVMGQMVSIPGTNDGNRDLSDLFYYNGFTWFKLSGSDVISSKFVDMAGPDIYSCEDTVQLNAYLPNGFTGYWYVSADGYSINITDIYDPKAKVITQYGALAEWNVTGLENGKQVKASDRLYIDQLPKNINLNLNECYIPENTTKIGFWEFDNYLLSNQGEKGEFIVLEGENGIFEDLYLYGQQGIPYKISFSYSNICGVNFTDTAMVYFAERQFFSEQNGLKSVLKGKPLDPNQTGEWMQVSGPGQSVFSNVNSDSTEVTVTARGTYRYKWQRSSASECSIYDYFDITFIEGPIILTTLVGRSEFQGEYYMGGNISDDGGRTITSRGICYGNSPNPSLDNSTVVQMGAGTGSFNQVFSNIATGKYYARAYGINVNDTAYGNEVAFESGYWGVLGDATSVGWNGPDFDMAYNVSQGNWSVTLDLFVGTIKIRNLDSWAENYGGKDGVLEFGGAGNDIPIPEAGNYTITMNLNTLTYTLVKNY